MEKQRLSKVLASAGVASRRACEQLIFDGKVTVNGELILKPETHVSLDTDDIRVDEQRVRKTQEKVYYVLNKPYGYICSNKPEERKRLVINLFPDDKRLFTVGRLDRDTTGLLLVTNDGHFAQQVIHPRSNIEKEYLVKTNQEIMPEHLKILAKGCFIDGSFIRPVSVKKVRRGTLKVVVKEGRKHEVRIMIKKADLELLSLTRIRIGGLHLGGLAEGKFRHMNPKEKQSLFKTEILS